MRVLITAAGGFIGQNLAGYLSGTGHVVSGTFRSPPSSMQAKALTRFYRMSLDDQRSDIDFAGFDAVVHLAHDFHPKRANTNHTGTIRLAEDAAHGGVTRQIFVSSYSARPDAVSEYGLAKYRLERYFVENGYEIVRPGLVLGHGGIVGRMTKVIKALPIIPIPSYGAGEIPFISIGALCEALRLVLNQPRRLEHNLFSRNFTNLKLLLEAIRSIVCKDRHRLMFRMPASIVLLGLQLTEILRLPIPLNVDNLKGFLQNQTRVHASTLSEIGMESETLVEAMKAANLNQA